MVDGALSTRMGGSRAELVELLAPNLSVYCYDRRGRGDSADTPPYAIEREIEDIEALIDEAGGVAFLYGHSSGGCLALEAAGALGPKVSKVALYEAPCNDDPSAQKAWGEYIEGLTHALREDRRGDAVALFMRYTGVPAERWAAIRTPTLVMCGGSSYPFMLATAETITKALPNAELRILDGQTHEVQPAVLAPVLTEFFLR